MNLQFNFFSALGSALFLLQLIPNCSLTAEQQIPWIEVSDFVDLDRLSEEENTSSSDFIVLNLQSEHLVPSEVFDLASRVLLENTDVVCIQQVAGYGHANDLYEALQDDYAYFAYVPPVGVEDGLLIASKYVIDQLPLNMFLEEEAYRLRLAWSLPSFLEHVSIGATRTVSDYSDSQPAMEETVYHFINHAKNSSLHHYLSLTTQDNLNVLLVKSKGNNSDDKNAGYSGQIGVDGKWGGKGGAQYGFHFKGEAHDDRGNYAQGEVRHNFSTKEGNAQVSGGHKEEKKKK